MAGRQPVASDEEILAVLAASDDPALSSEEVADALPIGQKGTYRRLRELEEEGLVSSKMFGPSRAWWITDAGREYLEEAHGGTA